MGVDPSILENVAMGEAQRGSLSGEVFGKFCFPPRSLNLGRPEEKRFRAERVARGRRSRKQCLCQDGLRVDTRYMAVINELQATGQTKGTERSKG